MSSHEQFTSDLALYAFDTLQGEERIALEQHMEQCPACRRELEALRGDLALLAISSAPQVPSAKARQRLLTAVAKEPRRAPSASPRRFWAFVPALAALALAIVTLGLWREDAALRREVSELARTNSQYERQSRLSAEVLATLNDPTAARFTLSAAKTAPQPQGKAIYARDRRSLVFLASNMPALPAQKAYELWLIPVSGAPIPSGMFKPDDRGSATIINPPLPEGVEAKTFAITVEPEGGSAAPTSQPIMVGAGG